MHDRIREQLEREVTRKEFLQVIAGLLLAVFGVHNLITFFLNVSDPNKRITSLPNEEASRGFGSRKFGI